MNFFQPELFANPERTPKSVAVDLIQFYVKRGDSLDSLKKGQMGSGNSDESACIGEYCQGKKFSTDFIIVSKFNGIEICEVFKLKSIYDEIKKDSK